MKYVIPEGFINYTDYTMIRYSCLYKCPFQFLSHLFYVNGNGYHFENDTICGYNNDNYDEAIPVDELIRRRFFDYKKDRNLIIGQSFAQSLESSIRSKMRFYDHEDGDLATCIKEAFQFEMLEYEDIFKSDIITQDAFEITSMERDNKACEERAKIMPWYRDDIPSTPYPLSKGYARCFDLNEKTPKWLVELCFNCTFIWLKHMKENILPNEEYMKKCKDAQEITDNLEEVILRCFSLL